MPTVSHTHGPGSERRGENTGPGIRSKCEPSLCYLVLWDLSDVLDTSEPRSPHIYNGDRSTFQTVMRMKHKDGGAVPGSWKHVAHGNQ